MDERVRRRYTVCSRPVYCRERCTTVLTVLLHHCTVLYYLLLHRTILYYSTCYCTTTAPYCVLYTLGIVCTASTVQKYNLPSDFGSKFTLLSVTNGGGGGGSRKVWGEDESESESERQQRPSGLYISKAIGRLLYCTSISILVIVARFCHYSTVQCSTVHCITCTVL